MTVAIPFIRRLLGVTIAIAIGTPASAATVPSGFSESLIASGLRNPTAMAFAPDGRLFVCEQGGTLRVVKNGALLATPFVTLTVNASGERGLLGVAFDPAFAVNGFVYVYYTATSPAVHNRVSRFTAAGDVAAAGSETILVDLETLGATNHNGGALHFGNDGKLYIAVGENAVSSNSQTLANRLGKILRINADGTIPADNPFVTQATGDNRAIWALGLRNPFTFAFQPVSGTLFIDDVGENTWEEIDLGVAGANYGWPVTEGPTNNPPFQSPLYAYDHSNGCAIAGGAFHSLLVAQFPLPYWGAYFFADLCGGWIHVRRPDGTVGDFASDITQPVDLAFGGDGSLFYLARGGGGDSGVVSRISYDATTPSVHMTANGSHAPVSLASGDRLSIALSLDNVSDPNLVGELFIGIITSGGVLWAHPTNGLVTQAVPVFVGPLPAFGPSTVIAISDVAALPPGPYWWFVLVDINPVSFPVGALSDMVLTIVRQP